MQRTFVWLLATVLLVACGASVPHGTVEPAPAGPPSYPGPATTPESPATAVPVPGGTAYPAGTVAPAPTALRATATPIAPAMPAACIPQGEAQGAYFDLVHGYCLLYPAGFTVRDQRPGPVGVFGPPLDQSSEPVRATLTINVDPAHGRTLQQVVDEIVAQAGNTQPVTRTSTSMGGEPAEILAGMPGRTQNRQVLVVHGDRAYRLILFPVDPGFPQAGPDIDRLWASVSRSFTFLPPEFSWRYTACPQVPEPSSPLYVNPSAGYCLLYPPGASISETFGAAQTTTLSAPPHERGLEAVMATLTISSSESANGRGVQQIVDAYLATFPTAVTANVTRTQATIGGHRAIVLDGVPARLPAREAFLVYQDRVLQFTLQPFGDTAFQAYDAEVDALWQHLTETIVFVDQH